MTIPTDDKLDMGRETHMGVGDQNPNVFMIIIVNNNILFIFFALCVIFQWITGKYTDYANETQMKGLKLPTDFIDNYCNHILSQLWPPVHGQLVSPSRPFLGRRTGGSH